MIVQVHGFDWAIYAGRVMPAFSRWLIDKDEHPIYQLFERTRCAKEEQFLPEPMQRLRAWPRASAFVNTLPRGPHSRKEYARLCSAEQFTLLSDQYLHQHTPHLYQNSAALRTIWGAVIEEYCLPWLYTTGIEELANEISEGEESEQTVRGELVSLLHAAGLPELAREVGEQSEEVERFEWEPGEETHPGVVEVRGEAREFDLYADDVSVVGPKGTMLGSYLNTLRLRGWLAGISLRAMVLFEFLACGRRSMPFGYEPGEPFGAYRGYLTPDETWQLANLLHNTQPPGQAQAEKDYRGYSEQQTNGQDTSRFIDEVLPTNAHDFLKAVRRAALQRGGLICSVD